MEELRERYFGPSFELLSHDKVRNLTELLLLTPPSLSLASLRLRMQRVGKGPGSIELWLSE